MFTQNALQADGSRCAGACFLLAGGNRNNVTGYRIKQSKFNPSGCLTLQFLLGDARHIVFTGSGVLIDQLKTYSGEIPFWTVIRKIDKYFTMT